MDVLNALDALEQYVRESPRMPFADLRAVDRGVMEQLLRATRRELERAQQEPPPVRSRYEVLNQAAHEGRLLVEAARQEAQETLGGDRIKALTGQRFEEIVDGGRQRGNEVMRRAYGYSVERMSGVGRRLETLRKQVNEGLEVVQKAIKEAEKARRQRKKEVSRKRARGRLR